MTKNELVDMNYDLVFKVNKLEKENAELKAEIGLNEATIEEQLKEKVALYKQIEKMKCCGNCKFSLWDKKKNRLICSKNGGDFFECTIDEWWELAE